MIEEPQHQINWILIRGLARGRGHWGNFTKYLKASFLNSKIYYVDIPGNGELSHLQTPLSIKKFIPFFEQQLKEQNFNPQIKTYGYSLSLGSMAMAEWAQQKPFLFSKIFLSNTSSFDTSPFYKRLLPKAIFMGLQLCFITEIRKKEILSLLTTTSLKYDELIQNHHHEINDFTMYSLKHSTQFRNSIFQILAASHFKFPKRLKVDVVLMNGLNDQFVHCECSLKIAKKFNFKILTHPTAGHDISFEDPFWVLKILTKEIQEEETLEVTV